MHRLRGLFVALAAFALPSCTLEPLALDETTASCSSARRLPTGACCPPWTTPVGWNGCRQRDWSLAGSFEGAESPDVAVGHDGEVALSWLKIVGTLEAAVVLAHEADDFQPWSPTAPLVGSAIGSRIAAGPNGRAVAVWRRSLDEEQFIETAIRSESGWRTYPQALNPPPSAAEPEVAIRANGEIVATWNQWSGLWLGVAVARLAPGESVFETPADPDDVVSPPLNFSNNPEIAVNEAGDAIVTWYQAAGDELMTFVSERHGSDGRFSRPDPDAVLSPFGAPVEDPAVDLAADGSAAVVWRQETGTGQAAIYLALRDAEGRWDKPSSLTESFSEPADAAWDARVSLTDDGHLYVLWREERQEDIAIVAAHRDPNGRWLAGGRAPLRLSSPSVPCIDPVLAVGLDGHVVAGWTRLEPAGWQVIVRRSSTDMAEGEEGRRWSAAEVLSSEAGGVAGQTSLAIGGIGDRVALAFVQDQRLQLVTID